MNGNKRVARIRELNDQFRKSGEGGQILFTRGLSNKGVAVCHRLLAEVRRFDKFDRDNDPHGEHDFGNFEDAGIGERVFWKIDYYDKALEYGSEAPEDPEQTTRVLTIMLASEY